MTAVARSPSMSQFDQLDARQTPLLDALRAAATRPHAPFYTPGHKRGQGISPRLAALFGTEVFRADLPELPDLDNLFAPEGVIRAAQDLAAIAFGAGETWFLANGSTCGIQAAVLATCAPGDALILPRNAHRCAIAALILSGAMPMFVTPELDSQGQIPLGVSPAAIAQALEHPAAAVLLVSPTYHGVSSDLEAIASLVHSYNLPLIVDEAHGAHFAFHPQLPQTAIAAGADLAVQSIHKTLGAMTQAAMVHSHAHSRIDRDRLVDSLALVQSSSPSYLLLASLDAARHQMAIDGEMLMAQTLDLADWARLELAKIDGVRVWTPPTGTPWDRTRLTVDVSGLGWTGFAADEHLHQTLGVTAELPSLHHLTLIISLGNTREDLRHLVQGIQALAQAKRSPLSLPNLPLPPLQVPILSPRQAFFSRRRTVPVSDAIGQVCAELICPYPPGIPVLMPGEPITIEAIAYLTQICTMGGTITGCADPTLQTLSIVEEAIARP
ncbi:MAG: aminotransferase class I/II-fold pyridoxal phosphate-dependent enzyme [Leptolyngbya sp. DLM2.Bin15]|nr:MAG: aminotransferase class I/II-fold pyridoxal phosphate-dependent enzyme [Leptolyngbya sp. DLM2.Bin15]